MQRLLILELLRQRFFVPVLLFWDAKTWHGLKTPPGDFTSGNWNLTSTNRATFSKHHKHWKPKIVQSSRSKMSPKWNTDIYWSQIPMESMVIMRLRTNPQIWWGLLQSSKVEPPCDLEAMFVVRRLGQQKVLHFFTSVGPYSPHGLHTEDWKMGWNVCKHSWKWAGMLRQKWVMLLHSKVWDSGNNVFWSFCSV